MKEKIKFKNIFLRTVAMFFIFYFIAVSVFTGIYYKVLSDGNKVKFDNIVSILKDTVSNDISTIEYERLSEGRTGYWVKDANNSKALNKDICKLTELNSEISYLTLDFSKELFAKAYLYDENGDMIAKSRNSLRATSFHENVKSKKDYSNINRYIDIDKYFSEEQKVELYKMHDPNSTKAYIIKAQGYIQGNEIIPEVIDVYKNKIDGIVSVDEALESAEKIKTFNFNVQGVEGLRKIDFAHNLDSNWVIHEINYVYNPNKNNDFYKEIFQRYNNFNEYNENEIRSIINQNGNIYKK